MLQIVTCWITDEETEPAQAVKNENQGKSTDKKNVRRLQKIHTSLIDISFYFSFSFTILTDCSVRHNEFRFDFVSFYYFSHKLLFVPKS